MKNDIERMFYQDVRDKKRTGSGVFKRRGKGVKHGIGSVKFAYQSMNRKDKREYTKSSKVRTYNMNDILTMDEFKQLGESDQKQFLERWRDKHSNIKIMEKMGISKNIFYDLVDKLNVKKSNKKGGNIKKETFPAEKIEYWKDNFVDYEIFKIMVREQQGALFDVYNKQFNVEELAEMWNIPKHQVHNIKYRIRNFQKKQQQKKKQEETIELNDLIKSNETDRMGDHEEKKDLEVKTTTDEKEVFRLENKPQSENMDSILNQLSKKLHPKDEKALPVVTELLEKRKSKEGKKEAVPKLEASSSVDLSGFNFDMKGDFGAEQILNRLSKLVKMLEINGENCKYRINIQLSELEHDEEQKVQLDLFDQKQQEPEQEEKKQPGGLEMLIKLAKALEA